ncbi:25951_t:CDS:2 [Gigaspora margarita]|uniref:25951_t:CDS:1 n=1 Tax=Gigaspora margarita TaxID=4874 RepID=A0ABN7UP67_GIGMA|nr:25951_t:CDS:2 [Gigaspora margarita]
MQIKYSNAKTKLTPTSLETIVNEINYLLMQIHLLFELEHQTIDVQDMYTDKFNTIVRDLKTSATDSLQGSYPEKL